MNASKSLVDLIREHQPDAFKVWPVSAFLPGAPAEATFAIRVLLPRDEDDVKAFAAKYVATLAETKAGLGKDMIRGDAEAMASAITIEALHRACFDVGTDGAPGPSPAFTIDWLRKESPLRGEQLGALYALYVATQESFALAPRISAEQIEDLLVPLAESNATTGLPEIILSRYPMRVDVVSIATLYAATIVREREAFDVLAKERDALQEQLAAMEAPTDYGAMGEAELQAALDAAETTAALIKRVMAERVSPA